MEKKNNNYLTLCIILSAVVLLLGGFVVYDKVLRKDEGTSNVGQKCQKCEENLENEKNSGIDIKNVLSSLIFKLNSNGEILSYDINSLSSKDINDIICNYILYNGTFNEASDTFEMDSALIENVIKNVIGKKIDISAGLHYYGIHTLTKSDSKYIVSRKKGIPEGVPNSGTIQFGTINNIDYKKDGEIIIDVDVNEWESESPYYRILGSAKISFNFNNSIKFNSFKFTKAKTIDTYSMEVVQ